MTPEERARKWAHSIGPVDLGSYEGVQIIAAAIREAVAEERERAAKIAEAAGSHNGRGTCWQCGDNIAAQIREIETPNGQA
jgi:hypothetical protein